MSRSLKPSPVHESIFSRYRYPLIGTYAFVTGLAFLRISRQPYSQSIKWEQYETVFKFTSLGAVLGGIGVGGLEKRNEGALKT